MSCSTAHTRRQAHATARRVTVQAKRPAHTAVRHVTTQKATKKSSARTVAVKSRKVARTSRRPPAAAPHAVTRHPSKSASTKAAVKSKASSAAKQYTSAQVLAYIKQHYPFKQKPLPPFKQTFRQWLAQQRACNVKTRKSVTPRSKPHAVSKPQRAAARRKRG